MRKLFTLCLLVFTLSASAQWQQTGSKVRYVNGLGIPTRDTAAGVAADSSQILIRPADSSLYIKYKRTWVKVGAGGTIGGSGTTNRVPKFTGATTLGNSSIVDSASAVAMTINPSGNVGIGTTSPNNYSGFTTLSINNATNGGVVDLLRNNIRTGSIYTGVSGADFNVNAVTNIPMLFWTNNTERMRITSGGNALIGTTTDNGTDRLQVSGNALADVLKSSSASNNLLLLNGTGTTNSYIDFQNAGTTQWRAGNDYNSGNRLFRINDVVGSRNTMIANNLGQIGFNMPTTSFINSSTYYQLHSLPGNSNLLYSLSNNATAGVQVYNQWNFQATKNNTWGSYGATLNGDYIMQIAVAGSGNSGYTNNSGNIVFIQNGAVGTHTPLDLTLGVTNSSGTYYTAILKQSGSLDLNTSLNVNGVADNGVDKINVTGPIRGTGFRQAYVTKTGAYTAANDDYVIDCTSGTFTVTLPASSGRTGRILIIKNSGAGTITVDGNAAETIDGAATYSLATQYATVQIMSDGTNWKIISKF